MKTTLRICFVLALSLLLTAPVSAASSRHRSVSAPARLASQAWNWLLQLTAKAGGGIDPDGATSMQCVSDHGIGIDPNGATCAAATQTGSDHGIGIDPDGLH